MKKPLLLSAVLLMVVLLFMGQKSQDTPEKWNNPAMTKIYQMSDYVPLPQTDNVVFSTSPRNISTPNGTFAVSPNFRVHPSAGTQSEVPIVRHPSNQLIMLGSANTYRGGSTFSTGVYVTTDGGATWFGSDTLNNGQFSFGDPGPMIDKNGRFLMSYITTAGSMGASYSTNNGINWAPTVTFPGASTQADKNLSGTDDAPSSPYYGRSYTVYTEFAGSFVNRIVGSYTTDGGVTWSSIAPISPPTSPGHHHQGCDVRVGPNGEVYVVWANCTTNGQNSTEDSLGFAKSTNGGVSWIVSTNSANNMNGIRAASLFNSIRANGFPRIDVDRSGGTRNGWIYVVTAEKNVAPATDVADVILHKSTDEGTTWSSSRVNQDTPDNGKYQYMPAVRVDEYGGVNIVYYDTRNIPTNDSAQIYVSRSVDGGTTWSEILVSDHKFKPKPISGLATGYQGDYIGITSGNGKIWPYWAEDITGIYQAWTSSIDIGPAIDHTPLANTEQLSGSYAVNSVITPSGSGINPSKTRMFWSRNNVNITDSILMTKLTGNNWTANIPANGAAATYRYYIKTTDSLNRTATSPSGAPAVLNLFIASTDNVKPVISHTPLVDQAKAFWPSTVPATVTDNLGLDSVWVKWYKNTPSPVKQFRLINQGGSSFSAAFNSLNSDVAINDSIFYRIFAQDNSMAHNRDSSSLYKFKITELQLCEDFEAATYPPDLWSLDYTGTLYWTREAVSANGIGAGATKFNFYNASAGTNQSLVTLPFSNSVLGDSIRFDNAYAPYTTGTDSLIIETSSNGGITFTSLIGLSGSASGGTLNTAPTQTGVFTPASDQWARKNYTLPVGTNMIKFRARSGYGNNLFIDNICKVAGVPPPPPPVVTADQDTVITTLSLNGMITKNLSLGNSGGSLLNWSLEEIDPNASPVKSTNSFTEAQLKEIENMPKGADDIYQGSDVTDASGGPDAFGYTWIDSDEPGGPTYDYVDISGTGTAITTWTSGTADDGSAIVSLPFNFNYYGADYSQLKICTNGWVSFDIVSTSNAYSNTAIPSASDPNNTLMPFWDDQDLRTSGTVYYYNDVANSRFIVEYKDVPHYSSGGPYTYQVILNSDGSIVYQYQSITTPDNSATIGFENSTGTDGLQMVFNNIYVHNNLAIRIQSLPPYDAPWLSENPLSGSISPAGNQNVDLNFDATGLPAGSYNSIVRVSSNDPVTPVKNVHVKLNVVTAVPANITIALQGFYNNTTLNIRDTSRVYLRNVNPPYNIVDSAKAVIDSVTFTGSFFFVNAPTGTYYLQVKSRNGLETWSKPGGQLYTAGSPFSYNFTTAAAQTYGSNAILKAGKYCQYNGDINQDGNIDLTDVIGIFNASSNFTSGYVIFDLNGDYFTDLTDITIAYNNANQFVSKSVPPGAGPVNKSTVRSRSEDLKEYMRKTEELNKASESK